MTLIEKLAPYLPYDTLIRYKYTYGNETEVKLKGIHLNNLELMTYCKPILRPLSDLLESDFPYLVNDHSTDYFADTDNYIKVKYYIDGNIFHHYTEFLPYGLINWLLKNHYDVFGMIEAGEAIDINTINR